jgi:hypothetical protein
MSFFRRLLAGLVFLLALAIFLLVVGAGVGVWIVKGPVTARAHYLAGHVEENLDIADQSLDLAGASLAKASESLDKAKQDQRELAKEARNPSAMERLLLRTVKQRLAVAVDLENANETLHKVAEAAFVVNSVLDDVGSFPLLAESGFNMKGLTDMNERLGHVAPAVWDLSRLLGSSGSGSDPDAAGGQSSQIEQTVGRMQKVIADYHAQVKQVRERVDGLKARTFKWITPAAILISFACFWFALSQISLMAHAISWWRGPAGR